MCLWRLEALSQSRLKERGLVRHKEKYWALGDDEHLVSYTAISQTFATVDERVPPEDQDDSLPSECSPTHLFGLGV